MKYAIIGCGRISTNHIKAALENKLEVACFCDIRPENMEALLLKHDLQNSDIRKYTDYKEMLLKEKPQLVAIATESGLHAEIALDCLSAGANIIVEKPIAMSMEDAQKIIDKAAETGLKACACHQNRFNVAVQKMRNAVEKGAFGKISHGSIHVRWNRNKDYYTQAPWRGTWEQDGGCLMNQCIHGIDLLRWMMGDEVVSVYGVTRQQTHSYLEAEDIGMAVLTFKDGSVATVEGTTNVYPKNLEETLFLFGEDGTVKLGGKSTNAIDVWDFKDEQGSLAGYQEQTENVYGNGHTSLYADVVEAIVEGREPYIDAVAGKNALEIVLAIYKSQKTKQPVSLPLENFGTLDMVGEF